MSLSATQLAILVQGLLFLAFAACSARQFFREPIQSRFHTLLIFASGAWALLLVGVSLLLAMLGAPTGVAALLTRLSLVFALCSAYALFLLTADLTSLHHLIGWSGIALLLLSAWFALAAPPTLPVFPYPALTSQPPTFPFFILLILLISLLALAARLWHSAAAATGALRRRLQWVGVGVTLLGGSTAFALSGVFASRGVVALTWTEHLLLLLGGVLLYVGAAPPTWLRRLWMLPELERLSQFASALLNYQQREGEPSQQGAMCQMLQYAMNALGALVGVVELWNEGAGRLEVAASILPSEESFVADAKAVNDAALEEVFQSQQALMRPLSARKWPFLRRQLDAGVVLVAPLVNGAQRLGVLGICCEHAPGLNAGDLARLQLFADQMARWLVRQQQMQEAATLVALRDEQAMKDEFIALIAHDLRTPLTVLKGRLQLLRRQLTREGQTAAADAVAKLDAPYNRLGQLISTLLDVSYIDTGRLQLLRHAIDLPGLVRKATEASQGHAIELEVGRSATQTEGSAEGSSTPMIVLGDAGRLDQALGNLLDNARKYSPVEGKIIVRVERRPESEEALVSVRDFGIGIPPADQPRLLERWFRATNSPSQHYAGVGLGLYICHEIISRHGGRLWVESSGVPGEGSTFFFTLPLLRPDKVVKVSSPPLPGADQGQ